jgi:hypothetical protein
MSNSNKYLVMSLRWGLTPRLIDSLTVSRNVTFTLARIKIELSSGVGSGNRELSLQSWQLAEYLRRNGKKGIRLCKEAFMCDLKLQ